MLITCLAFVCLHVTLYCKYSIIFEGRCRDMSDLYISQHKPMLLTHTTRTSF